MASREEWADDHGYSRGTCREHGSFWTDTGDGCPSCPPPHVHRCEVCDVLVPCEDECDEECQTIVYCVNHASEDI
jgi:hypothetical protein